MPGIIALDEERDIAILSISTFNRPSLHIGKMDTLGVGEKIYAVGNPLGLEGTFSEGIISGLRHVGADIIIQITAPISPGSSGGPILNSSGDVVGVATATFKAGQNLNFAIPISYVSTLLRKPLRVIPMNPEITRSKKRKYTESLGEKNINAIKITHFSWRKGANRYGYFGFSIRNMLDTDISDVKLLFTFYDQHQQPIDIKFVEYKRVIPARLAKRIESLLSFQISSVSKNIKVEPRVLDFKIAR